MLIDLPHALAYTTGFEDYAKKYGYQPPITRIPIVCAEQPSDFPTSQGQLNLYMQTVQDRVSEWSSRLSEGATNLNEWKINYIVFDPQKQPNFNLSSCDILVVLQAVPHVYDQNNHNYLGYEQYNSNGWREVVVNYEFYKDCGYPPTYSGYICPTGTFLTIPQLSNVLLHELGHALGLGHYVSDDPNVIYGWDIHPNDAPSIMIPYTTVDPEYQHITELDVQQVHKMYNYKGFLAFTPQNAVDPFDSVTANAYLTNFNGDQTPVVSVNAQISPQYYNRGDKIYITITDSEGHQIYDQDFLTTDSFSQIIMPQGLVSGTYTLNAVYDGMKSPDVSFAFLNTSPLYPSPTPSTMQTQPIQSQPQNTPIGASTIPVDGTQYSVTYTITNSNVLDIKADQPHTSLLTSIQTTGDGILTITLPRALIDSKNSDGTDKPYIVSNDGQIAQFTETGTTGTDRTFSIPFSSGTQQIAIMGTFIIPEFGSLAGMIIAISIIGVVIISRRFRFHFSQNDSSK